MPQGKEEASYTAGAVPSTPSPVLFSSDEQAVPQSEEECEKEIGYHDQGRAAEEGTKDNPRGSAAEEPGGWMDSIIASLGNKGDQCITVGQLSPLRRLKFGSRCRGRPWRHYLTVLGMEVNNRLQEKLPIMKQV